MAITVPYVFAPGTTILSAQANANFARLVDALDKTGDTISGNISVASGITIDGADISAYLTATQTLAPVVGSASAPSFAMATDVNTGMYFSAADQIAWALGGTKKLELTATGLTVTNTLTPLGLIDASGAAAGQVQFPATQNASTDVNTLDDYEEGSWTPVIGGSGGTSGQTYGHQVGKYVKIGKLVYVTFSALLTAKGTITTSVQIQGLPFTSENVPNQFITCPIQWDTLGTTWVSVVGFMDPNTTVLGIIGTTVAAVGNSTALTTADIANTTRLVGSFSYRATA